MKIFLILITSSLVIAGHLPSTTEKKDFNPYLISRFFKTINNEHTIVTTIDYRKDDDRNTFSGEISLRRNISRFVQYGLEVDLTDGLRHDEDWVIKNKESGDWQWKEGDLEFGSTLFLKLKRDFYISERTFSVSANIKTHNNWTNTLLTLKPEFNLTYHHFNNGVHKFNIYLKNTYYIPFNYSDEDIYTTWYYLGYVHNYSKQLKPAFFIAIKDQTWTPSDKYKETHPLESEQYKVKSTLSYIGIALNFYY